MSTLEMLPPVNMKVFFSQPEFDAQLLRTLSYTPFEGADLGECLTAAAKIKESDFDSWYQEWKMLADRLLQEGEQALKAGYKVSAKSAFLRASNYYRTCYFFLAGSPVDPRLEEAFNLHVSSFAKALSTFTNKVQDIVIPYKDTSLSGHFYHCQEQQPCPTIVTFPGYDGTKQECYFSVVKSALERGFHVLCIDGPGQGDALIKKGIAMTSAWEEVVTPAINYLATLPYVRSDQIILFGISWGGMLAPLAACKEHRIAALVASPGQYEALLGMKKALPQVEELLKSNNFIILDQILTTVLADKMIAAKFRYKMWVHGLSTASELLQAWAHYSLASSAQKITCPTLVVDYENEYFSRGQAMQLYDALQCPKTYLLGKRQEGAGEHCGAGALTHINNQIFNWLESILKPL